MPKKAKRSRRESLKDSVKTIGRLSFNRSHLLGSGSFANVYRGTFKESEETPEINVAIKRIEKTNFKETEKLVLENIEYHPNVLHYYCTEEDEDFV